MSREWRLYLADLLLGCEKIQRYTSGLDRESCLIPIHAASAATIPSSVARRK